MPKGTPSVAWFVYLVRCSDGTLYCGVTNNLDKRIAAHNSGKGAKYTRQRRPVVLVWFGKCRSKSATCKAEYAIKRLKRNQKQRLVSDRFAIRNCRATCPRRPSSA
jgi:putative endonuclease